MKEDNGFYGHRNILARYAGVRGEPVIWGYLQHGWDPDCGFPIRYRYVRQLPVLVWSMRNAVAAARRGITHLVPVGSPFLYLPALDPAPATSQSTIVYPFHSAPGEPAHGSHEELAATIVEREPGAITVCLYWLDHAQHDVRRVYEEHGCRVITHGQRSDGDFLRRQRAELQSHDRVVGNRLGTALWYGAALGKNVEVYGPVFSLAEGEGERWHAFCRSEWPELFDGGFRGAAATDLAMQELGAEYMRSPSELRRLLGWTPTWRALGRASGGVRRARVRAQGGASSSGAASPAADILDRWISLSRAKPRARLRVVGAHDAMLARAHDGETAGTHEFLLRVGGSLQLEAADRTAPLAVSRRPRRWADAALAALSNPRQLRAIRAARARRLGTLKHLGMALSAQRIVPPVDSIVSTDKGQAQTVAQLLGEMQRAQAHPG